MYSLSLSLSALQALPKCFKSPLETNSDKTEGDNGFAVLINGSPRLYRPNQIYTITLRVRRKKRN